MRSLAALSALTLLAAATSAPVAGAADASEIQVNWICERAFAEAAQTLTAAPTADVLDAAVRSCSSPEDWSTAASMHPEAIGEVDALTFLARRCEDGEAHLAGYATCHGLGYLEDTPAGGAIGVRSDRVIGALRRDVAIEIILDTSSSMRRRLAGVSQIDVAKDSLRILVRDALPQGVPLAIRTFGADGGDAEAACGSTLTARLAPLDRAATLELVDSVHARKHTKSPIADSIAAVAQDLANAPGPHTVVLVTDGTETCGGDPIKEIDRLHEAAVGLTINVVGFALEDEALRDTMAAWATAGRGQYFDASSTHELAAAIGQAVASVIDTQVRLIGEDGTVIEGGIVGGAPVDVPAGTYRVVVLADPNVEFSDVIVADGARVDLILETGASPER